MKERDYLTIQNAMDESFIQTPKWLLYDPSYAGLSSDAKILYSFLKDRCRLSIKNSWYDKNNKVYVICRRDEMQSLLNKSDKTVKKIVDELLNANLIEEKKNGQGKANYIYLLMPSKPDYVEVEYQEEDDNSLNRNNSDSRIVNAPIQEAKELRPNNNDYSNNKLINKNLDSSSTIYKTLFRKDNEKYELDGMYFSHEQMDDIERLIYSAMHGHLNSSKSNILKYLHKLYDNDLKDSRGQPIKSIFNFVSNKFNAATLREIDQKGTIEKLAEDGDVYAKQALNYMHV